MATTHEQARSSSNVALILIGPCDYLVETIAINRSIRERNRLIRAHGLGRWRKRKGIAIIQLENGETRLAELHWYEATGIGKREFKIKRILD